MRVDDESKVVVPDFVADWYESVSEEEELDGNDVFRIIQDVLKVAGGKSAWDDYDVDKKLVEWVEKNEETFLRLIVNCKKRDGYEVVPKKYCWRKKKEYLAWFEDTEENYLNVYFSEIYLDVLGDSGNCEFTEAEARELLKDDFDKFKKVEINE